MKKLIALIIALCVVFSMSVTALAENPSSSVDLTVVAPNFSVTVPSSLPVTMSANGTISVDNTKQIVNNSDIAVKVTDISVVAADGWTVQSGNSFTDRKQFNMKINNCAPESAAASFATIPANGGTADINYSIEMPRQVTAGTAKIASVVYTIAFDESFTPVQSAPEKVSGSYVLSDDYNTRWDAIAKYGDYYLLLSSSINYNDLQIPSLPTCSVIGVNKTGEISLPDANGTPETFDLSETEFLEYCQNNSYVNGVSGDYMLRNSSRCASGSDFRNYTCTSHREACWVQGVTFA